MLECDNIANPDEYRLGDKRKHRYIFVITLSYSHTTILPCGVAQFTKQQKRKQSKSGCKQRESFGVSLHSKLYFWLYWNLFDNSFCFVVYLNLISKKKNNIEKALLCSSNKDKKWSLKIIDCLKKVEQKFRILKGKILRHGQIVKFCISKNMAPISHVSGMRLCFWKCKILLLDRVLDFSPKQVKLQNQFFFRIVSVFLPFSQALHSPFSVIMIFSAKL